VFYGRLSRPGTGRFSENWFLIQEDAGAGIFATKMNLVPFIGQNYSKKAGVVF